jgi:hypothetical protein
MTRHLPCYFVVAERWPGALGGLESVVKRPAGHYTLWLPPRVRNHAIVATAASAMLMRVELVDASANISERRLLEMTVSARLPADVGPYNASLIDCTTPALQEELEAAMETTPLIRRSVHVGSDAGRRILRGMIATSLTRTAREYPATGLAILAEPHQRAVSLDTELALSGAPGLLCCALVRGDLPCD